MNLSPSPTWEALKRPANTFKSVVWGGGSGRNGSVNDARGGRMKNARGGMRAKRGAAGRVSRPRTLPLPDPPRIANICPGSMRLEMESTRHLPVVADPSGPSTDL